MAEQPLFSVITVTYNAARVIAPTLKSVAGQTAANYEYVVIDGASTDDTLDMIRHSGIQHARIFSEPDRGLYDAMNKGIKRALGKYLIFLNAGDAFASPTTLHRLSLLAKDNPGVIYGQTAIVDNNRQVIGKRHLTAPKRLTADSFSHGMLVCHQAFVARKDLVPEYDLTYRFSADFDWCIKVLKKSPANAYAGKEPIIHFLDGGLTTTHHRASLLERYRIMKTHYGFWTTAWRHISFVPRAFFRSVRRRVSRLIRSK